MQILWIPYPDSYTVFYRANVLELAPFGATEESVERALLTPDQARHALWVQRNRPRYDAALEDARRVGK